MVELEFFDPSGVLDITQAHAPRLNTLDGKRVAMLSNDQWQSNRTLPMLKSIMESDFPGLEVLPLDTFPSGEHIIGADATIQHVKDSGVDAVVIGNAACGSCSTALARAAAKLESLDVPTVLLGRTDFLGVVRNAVSGLGLPPEAAVVDFPVDLFLPGSDLNAIRLRKQEFYDCLTSWRPTSNHAGNSESPLLKVSAETYEDALREANNFMLANLWGDGLPLWPATKTKVDWILQGTDIPRSTVLGKVMPRGKTGPRQASSPSR